ncbi:hypothetical protein MesoLj113b_60370 [Mesorhizobium sp. 113-3-3]|nr:hypothetical protein MesoLj113b_60370 [Mesorhizobium sp. 113-3-3]
MSRSTNSSANANSKFAKLLDLLAVDQDDLETVAVENAAHMSDFEAVKVADLIYDFYCEIT